MKGVSIIIACYKAGDYLREAVESVHAVAPRLPYEIIIVDDNSDDLATKIALNALHITDAKVRIVERPVNRGQSVARNQAIQMARYDYIMPLDADDLLDATKPGYLEMAVEKLEANPATIAVYCKAQMFGARSCAFLLPKYDERTMLVDNPIPVYGVFRRADALEIGGYKEDLRYTEDWEFWLALHNASLLKDKARHVERLPEKHYLYRQHDTGANVSRAQRMNLVDHTVQLVSRSAELYDHHLKTADPKEIAAIRHSEGTFMKFAFRRALGGTPGEFISYASDWVTRKYPVWKRDRAEESLQVQNQHIN